MFVRPVRWLCALSLLAASATWLDAQGNADAIAPPRDTAIDAKRPNLERAGKLDVTDTDLASALQDLALASGVSISYDPVSPALQRRVACACRDLTVREALGLLLNGTGLVAWTVGNEVVVDLPPAASGAPRARVGTITGVVSDVATGGLLAGVQVFVASGGATGAQAQGAVTNTAGHYAIAGVAAGQVVLRTRLIGYASSEKTVTVRDDQSVTADFALAAATLQLNQVVVTGTPGGAERRSIGNVVETVAAADVINSGAPIDNVEQTLGGRTAGLVVLPATGQVGTGAELHIRGVSSMSLSNDPIVYIDGIRMDSDPQQGPGQRGGAGVGRLNDINPDDIESIEIIKGPAAATIYGTQASNGVVQIITKKGKIGKPVMTITGHVGSNWMSDASGRTQNTYALVPVVDTIATENIWKSWMARGNGPIFGDGLDQAVDLNLTGGQDALRYFLSTGYEDNVGVVPWNYQRKGNIRANLDMPIGTDFRLQLQAGFVLTDTRLAQGSINSDPFSNIIWGSPLTLNGPQQGFYAAPPNIEKQIMSRADDNRTTTSVTATWFPIKWLTNRLTAGVDYSPEYNWTLIPLQPQGATGVLGSTGTGSKTIDNADRTFITIDDALSAKYTWKDYGFSTSAGFQYYKSVFDDVNATGMNFPAAPITTVSGGSVTLAGETYTENSEEGLYIEQQASWKNRAFVTIGLRGDDNSSFGTQYKAAYYPKISGAWVMSEEPWFHVRQINQLRLRAALGAAGTQPGTFDAAQTYVPAVGYKDQPALIPNSIGNPTLQPERSTELELGFEASGFDQRVDLIYSHFSRSITNAIVNEPVPPSEGFPGSEVVNIGKVNGWGDELTATYHAFRGRRFAWDIGTQLSDNGNQIQDLGPFKFLTVGQGGQGQNRVGYAIGDVFMYKVLSATINPATGAVLTSTCDGGRGIGGLQQGGAPTACSSSPRVYWGHSQPSWQLGFNNTFTILQDFRLYFRVEGNGGAWNDDTEIRALHNLGLSLPVILHNDPLIQAYRALDPDATGTFQNGFLKLRELSASYTLPPRYASTLFRASGASVSIGMRNIMMLWTAANGWNTRRDGMVTVPLGNMKAWDPETRAVGQLSGGYQTILPPSENVTMTIRLTY